jgi:hypothetical protein
MTSTLCLADPSRQTIGERGLDMVRCPIERLERTIAEMRMAAATGTDWEQIHVRSRELFKRLDRRNMSASTQIATTLRIRENLRHANDLPGLRSLRFATAGLIAGWLDGEATQEQATLLAGLFDDDQSLGTPGLAELEAELDQARTSVRPPGSHRTDGMVM